ncbi:MAG: T9SS type A sorting domain-containing protein [Bacteroidia bacterium]
MKKIYCLLILACACVPMKIFSQTSFCDSSGNVAIYSNYDGGILRINVDTNIANLKIGIVGYENDSIIISGAYSGNVTQVIFAGYFNSSNVHCTPWPSQKSITGVSAAITQINFAPPAGYNNPNGYQYIICNTSCDDSTNQGGCNTPDQVVDYFFNQFGSTKLLFHYTQYGCWNSPYNISDGGNCCAVPLISGITENVFTENISVTPNPGNGKFLVQSSGFKIHNLSVYDIFGNLILNYNTPVSPDLILDLSKQPKGMYILNMQCEDKVHTEKIVLQ